jgi:hypothetical protein
MRKLLFLSIFIFGLSQLTCAPIRTGKKKPTRTDTLFKCKKCTFTDKDAYEINEHFNKTHSPKDKFACGICYGRGSLKKSFSKMNSLKDHMMAHTGKYKFHCQYCEKGYIQRGNFNAHKRTCKKTKDWHESASAAAVTAEETVGTKRFMFDKIPTHIDLTTSTTPPHEDEPHDSDKTASEYYEQTEVTQQQERDYKEALDRFFLHKALLTQNIIYYDIYQSCAEAMKDKVIDSRGAFTSS